MIKMDNGDVCNIDQIEKPCSRSIQNIHINIQLTNTCNVNVPILILNEHARS